MWTPWGRTLQAESNKCKGPKTVMWLVCSKMSREAHVEDIGSEVAWARSHRAL